MKHYPTALDGAVVVEWPMHNDARGAFRRVADETALAAAGLPIRPRQWSLSTNHSKGTFRGVHFQWPPHEETKLVSCVTGRIFDVLIDLRPGSRTRGQAVHLELKSGDGKTLYVPPGIAHGFLCLEDNTTLLYGITPDYVADAASGVRWSDPALNLAWPLTPSVVSERDASWPDLAAVLKRMAELSAV